MEFGFPQLTESYLLGQDVLYSQFNEINFYVEDIDQENFYYIVLRKLFPNIVFNKIFPLGGKPNILLECSNNISSKKHIYILDLDFDDILNKKILQSNVFYLERYSIENYLIEMPAIKEIIIEQKPKIKENEINNLFNLDVFIEDTLHLFSTLIIYYLVIQKHELGIANVDLDTGRFCDFTKNPACLKQDQISIYHSQIENKLKLINHRFKIEKQLNFFKNHINSPENAIKHIPGKYILNFLKYKIEHLFSYPQISLESFTYRLAKNCSLNSLLFLQIQINNFLKT